MDALLWTQKYAPHSLNEFLGNAEAVEEVRRWSLEVARGKKVKPLLLHGPCGVGKTALIHALAEEQPWNLVETNASDVRNEEGLQRLYAASSTSAGLFGLPLLFVDEVDAVADRKEFSVLEKLARESHAPLIFVANDVWDPHLASLRFACQLVAFKRIHALTLKKKLKEIAAREGVNEELVEQIASNANGDLRAALNDLQALARLQPQELKPLEHPLEEGETALSRLNGRDRPEDLFNAVRHVLKTMHYSSALEAAELLNTSEFELFLAWLEQNVPLEYEKREEVAEAFHWLSRADVFQGRIRSRQNWGFLRYVRALGLAGAALSKKEAYRKFVKYEFPQAIKEMGKTKSAREVHKRLLRKTAGKLHVSRTDAQDALARLSVEKKLADYLELSEEEDALLKERFSTTSLHKK